MWPAGHLICDQPMTNLLCYQHWSLTVVRRFRPHRVIVAHIKIFSASPKRSKWEKLGEKLRKIWEKFEKIWVLRKFEKKIQKFWEIAHLRKRALSPLTAFFWLGDGGGRFGASRTLDDFDRERLWRNFLRRVAACNVSHEQHNNSST